MTKIIEIVCWFKNSEKHIDDLIKDYPYKIMKRKVPGGSSPTGLFLHENWIIWGHEDDISWFEKQIKDDDWDVDIIAVDKPEDITFD